jgi:Cof subfamily protein (haloacid dehalogenase superfamily)
VTERSPRLVATDLDGTLVHSDGSVTARTREVLAELDQRGVPVVFVTGRPLRWALEVFEHVGRHGLAIVANGALVWDVPGQAVHMERLLEREIGLEVAGLIRQAIPGASFAVETYHGIDLEPSFQERYPVPDRSRRGTLEEIFDQPVVKLLARHEEAGPQEFWDAAAAVVGERAVITWSSATALLEISGPGVTKASTLELVCAELGVAAAEVVAFGDMPNDIAMLRWSGASYAMANAHPTVRAVADHVAPLNDDDGVATTLAELFGL